MKKTIFILIMLLSMPIALAESEVSAGIMPGTFLYKLDVWLDDMRVKFADTNAEKARLRIEIAEERLAEMEKTAMENRGAEFEIAFREHKRNIEEIDLLTDEIDDDNEKVELQKKLQKHIMTLEEVKAIIPSRANIDNAINNSNKVFEMNQAKISVKNRVTKERMIEQIETGAVQIRRDKR